MTTHNLFTIHDDINFRKLLLGIDQRDAWRWLMQRDVDRDFTNRFRDDKKPGCKLKNYKGNVVLSDFGDHRFNGKTILQVISVVFNLTYQQAAYYLYRNYVLKNNISISPQVLAAEDEFKFKLLYKGRPFNLQDRKYWSQFGVSSNFLNNENVHAIEYYRMNTRRNPGVIQTYRLGRDIGYAININGRTKIYIPKKKNFISSLKGHDIGGMSAIKDDSLMIVTKSFKDYAVIVNQGYNCRYITCETCTLPLDFISFLNKFELVLFLMDNDEEGMNAAKRFEQTCREFTGEFKYFGTWYKDLTIKDSADVYKKYGWSRLENYITDLIEDCYEKVYLV